MNSTITSSSNIQDDSSEFGTFKKRRVQRACDMCRKRKIKCSGGEKPGESCVNCRVYKWACTFGDPTKNENPSKSYVEDLENRLQRTERLLKHLCPDESLLEELHKRFIDTDSIPLPESTASSSPSTFTFNSNPANSNAKIATNPLHNISTLIRSRAAETGPESIMGTMAKTIREVGRGETRPYVHTNRASHKRQDDVATDDNRQERDIKREEVEDEYESEDDASHVLASTLKDLHLEPQEYRFFGKSSGAMLIRRAIEMKSELIMSSSAASPSLVSAGVASVIGVANMAPLGSVFASRNAQGNEAVNSPVRASSSVIFSSTAPGQTPRRGALPSMMKNLRPEFWLPRPWELTSNKQSSSSSYTSSKSFAPAFTSSPSIFAPSSLPTDGSYAQVSAQAHSRSNLDFKFPPPDLGRSLIELYFANMNLFMPLLHRPTFDNLVERSGFLSWSDDGGNSEWEEAEAGFRFAHVYLLVCAVGAYFSNDPRCLLDASDVPKYSKQRSGPGAGSGQESRAGLPYSGGWKWFDQVQMSNRSLIAPPTLYDLQVYALSAQFLQASSASQSAWTMCGIGIRLAQDVGAHRRGHNTDGQGPTKQGELWKKAFWVLVVMDRMFSCHLGRTCAIQDEDFDLEPPLDCDDDFWNTTNPDQHKRFKQPLRKPSFMTHFRLYIELTHILMFSMRTVYSINKSQVLCGLIGPNWEQTVVSELDSALNKWADAVPDHLKWDPHRENIAFFNQSASLWATYYYVQILVHRPFIQSASPLKVDSLSMMPSLAICTNAARACCHIVDVQQAKTGPVIAHVQMAVFQSALILLLGIWGGKRSGLLIDPNPQMVDVRKCMQILKASEKTWYALGRLYDILSELASVGDMPSQSQISLTRNKREREQDHHHNEKKKISGNGDDIHSYFSSGSVSPNRPSASSTPLDSTAYTSILPAEVALPGIDYEQFTMPFPVMSTNSTPGYGYGVDDAALRDPDATGSQPAIHGHQITYSFDALQLPSDLVQPDSSHSSDPSTGYLGQNFEDPDLMDIWMNAPTGIELEELVAYLTNLNALTQNALGGSGMGWLGPENEY